MGWSYTERDPGLMLFTACLTAGAPMRVTSTSRILEIGCCEADWLHLAHKAWPDAELVGIDTRAPNVTDGDGKVTRRKANVLDPTLFEPGQFDAIVSLSAIEHVGLGHYRDPIDPDGDSHALANAWRWLKPGGWLYFDVPYCPTGYREQWTKCRIYGQWEHWTRLWVEPLAQAKASAVQRFEGFVKGREAGTLIGRPTEPVEPFHYVAVVWQKAG
jgi:SAM-dependent methyltransferase